MSHTLADRLGESAFYSLAEEVAVMLDPTPIGRALDNGTFVDLVHDVVADYVRRLNAPRDHAKG